MVPLLRHHLIVALEQHLQPEQRGDQEDVLPAREVLSALDVGSCEFHAKLWCALQTSIALSPWPFLIRLRFFPSLLFREAIMREGVVHFRYQNTNRQSLIDFN